MSSGTSPTSASNLSRASVSTKIFLIVAVFSLPIGVLAYLLASNYAPQIAAAQLEMSGNALQKPVMAILFGLQKGQRLLRSCEGDTCTKDLASTASNVSAKFQAARSENATRASDLKTGDDDMALKKRQGLTLQNLEAEWAKIAAAGKDAATPAERAIVADSYDHLTDEVRQLVSYVGDSSTLILDPDLDSYYLVDSTLLALPETAARIASTSSLATKILSGAGTPLDHAFLVRESALLSQDLERIAASTQTTFDSDADNHGISPTLVPNLRPMQQQLHSVVTSYLATLSSLETNPSQLTIAALNGQIDQVDKAALDYWNAAAAELDSLLQARIDDFSANRIKALGFSAAAVLFATLIAFALGRSITKPLQELVQNLGPGATLLSSSVERIAETSQNQTSNPDEAAIICEELNAHAEHMRSAVLELARHVEGSSAKRIESPTGQHK